MDSKRQEVDDFVLQEFLTDIIDGASTANNPGGGDMSFGAGFSGGMPNAMLNGNGSNGVDRNDSFNHATNLGGGSDDFGIFGAANGGVYSDNLVGSLGSGDFAAVLLNNAPIPGNMMMNVGNGGGSGDGNGGGGAQRWGSTGRGERGQTSKGRDKEGEAEAEKGEEVDDGGDQETRRKRQRESNLQAQRRCRERHRNHVTNLEKEVQEMRNEIAVTRDENKRLQLALHRNLTMVEECQKRWNSSNKERDELTKEKDELKLKMGETLRALKELSVTNHELETKLKSSVTSSPAISGESDAPPPLALGADVDATNQTGMLSLRDDATELMEAVRKELEAGAVQLSDAIEDGMKRLSLHLTASFRTFLVDGNACNQIGIFSVLANPKAPAEPGALPPCAAMMAQGPGQTQSVFKLAHGIARELDLTDEQRQAIVRRWRVHSESLSKLFDRRKKLTADALMLQGSSPVATLVDFMAIGSGALSGGIKSEEEMAEKGGILTLTGFAQHACRVEQVISELRENIGEEQKQNFLLVTDVVDDVLTPFQTCKICSMWPDSGCPDMLAISRAITVQSVPQLMQAMGGK